MQRTLFDLLDHAFRICLADIVDDDVRAEFSKHQRVSATKTSTSSSDENRLSVELNGWIALRVGRERPGAFEKLLVVEKGLERLVKQKVGSALTTGSLTPIPVGYSDPLEKSCTSFHLSLTAEGVKLSSGLKFAPWDRWYRTSETNPAPASKILPVTSGPCCIKKCFTC